MAKKRRIYCVLLLLWFIMAMNISVISSQEASDAVVIADGNAASIRVLRQFDSRQAYMPNGYVVNQIRLSPGGNLLAVQYVDLAAGQGLAPVVQLWDVRSTTLVAELPLSTTPIGIQFTPDESMVITVELDTVILWDALTGEKIRAWESERLFISYTVQLSSDGRLLAFSDRPNGKIIIWDVAHGSEFSTITQSDVQALTFSPSNTNFAFATGEGDIYLCTITSASVSNCDMLFNVSPVQNLMFDRSGNILMINGYEDVSSVYLNENQELVKTQTNWVNLELFSRTSGNVIGVTLNDDIHLMNIATGQTFPYFGNRQFLDINQEETIYAALEVQENSSPSIYTVQLINVENEDTISEFSVIDMISDLVFSTDGRYIVTSSTDGTILFWGISST